ncbi:MAG: hypothetical protein AB7O52_13570 [Planctomycetota bacterium]
MRIRVHRAVHTTLAAVGLGLSMSLLVAVVDDAFSSDPSRSVFWWFGGLGGILLVFWCLLRPAYVVQRPVSAKRGFLRFLAARRETRSAPPLDPAVVAKDRKAAKEKSRRIRRGPRWMKPPMTERYGLKLPPKD